MILTTTLKVHVEHLRDAQLIVSAVLDGTKSYAAWVKCGVPMSVNVGYTVDITMRGGAVPMLVLEALNRSELL